MSRKHPGWPFGSVMPYALDEAGRPLFLISSMAMHTQNLVEDAHASLLVTESESTDPLGVGGRPEGADHLVTSIDELRNEPGADRTARPSDEDSHRVLLFGIGVNVVTSAGFCGSLLMTPGARRM